MFSRTRFRVFQRSSLCALTGALGAIPQDSMRSSSSLVNPRRDSDMIAMIEATCVQLVFACRRGTVRINLPVDLSETMSEPLEHLVFASAHTETPAPVEDGYQDSQNEGKYLASKLIDKLPRPAYSHLTPELLVLFATEGSPERKRDLQEFLDGIWVELGNREESSGWASSVRLVGCSSAACIADGQVYLNGTALIALCSVSPRSAVNSATEHAQSQDSTRKRAITILAAACGEDAADKPDAAATALCVKLGLNKVGSDFNPHDNRFAMILLPGYKKVEGGDPKYEDPRLVRAFCKKTHYEIPVCGGSGAQAGGTRDAGYQFLDRHVFKNSVVAALIECDTQFGIAMNSSFKSMNPKRFIRINTQNDNSRRAQYTTEAVTRDLIQRRILERKLLILGAQNEEGDPTIYIPRLEPNATDLTFWRDVDEHRDLELLEAGQDEPNEAITSILEAARKRATLRDIHNGSTLIAEAHSKADSACGKMCASAIAGAIGFFCAGRLVYAGMEPDTWEPVLDLAASKLEKRPLIGGFVNGECGLDRTGRGVHNNLQLSSLVLGTQLTLEAQLRWGYQALSNVSKLMMEADSVEAAIAAALDGLLEAGFRGGMLSLLCPEGDDLVKPAAVVAQGARGGCWPSIIQRTKRKLNDPDLDILTFVCKEGKSQYVRDAWAQKSRCERNSREIVGVKSMFVGLLKDAKHKPLGVLQIDLGDRTQEEDLPDRFREFLDAYVNVVASALQRVISIEQQRADRGITESIYRAFDHHDPSKAAKEIIDTILDLLRLDLGFIRLRSDDGEHLAWCAGKGAYSAAISRQESGRHLVSVRGTGSSSSAASFDCSATSGSHDVRGNVGNNVRKNPRAINLRKELKNDPTKYKAELKALSQVKSFVNLAFSSDTKGPLGTLDIDAKEPWFFTQHKVDIIRNAASRLGLCLRASRTQEGLDNLSKMHGFASSEIAAASSSPLEDELPRALIEGAKRLCAEQSTVELWAYHHGDQKLKQLSPALSTDAPDGRLEVAGSTAFINALNETKASWISASDDSVPQSLRDRMQRDRLNGCVVVPLRAGGDQGRYVGTLFCYCAGKPKSLVEENLSVYAPSAAYSLQNWQLHHLARALNTQSNFQTLQGFLDIKSAELLGASCGVLWLYRSRRQSYTLPVVWGHPKEKFESSPPLSGGRTEKIRRGEDEGYVADWDLHIQSADQIPSGRKAMNDAGVKSSFGSRLMRGDECLGIIYFDFKASNEWHVLPFEREFHRHFTSHVAVSVARLSDAEELRCQQLVASAGLVALIKSHTIKKQLTGLAVCADRVSTKDEQLANSIMQYVNTIQVIGKPLTTGEVELTSLSVKEEIMKRWDRLREKSGMVGLSSIIFNAKESTREDVSVRWPAFPFKEVINNVIENMMHSIQEHLGDPTSLVTARDIKVELTVKKQDRDVLVFVWNSHPTVTNEIRNFALGGGPTLSDPLRPGWGFVVLGAVLHYAGGSFDIYKPRDGTGTIITLRIPDSWQASGRLDHA